MTADKRRIDACLKAGEGISTQNLEDNVPFLELAHQDDRKAQAEIGELLKMLAAAPEAKP